MSTAAVVDCGLAVATRLEQFSFEPADLLVSLFHELLSSLICHRSLWSVATAHTFTPLKLDQLMARDQLLS